MTDYTVFGTTNPGFTTYTAATNQTRGHEFAVTATSTISAIRFYRTATTITGAVAGRIYQVTTSTTGTFVTGTAVTFTLTGTGWQTATLTTPIALTTNQRYRAAIFFPNNCPLLNNYWDTGAGANNVSSGPLTMFSKANATGQMQGSFHAGTAIAYPDTGSGVAGNYGIDVTITSTAPVNNSAGDFLPFFGSF